MSANVPTHNYGFTSGSQCNVLGCFAPTPCPTHPVAGTHQPGGKTGTLSHTLTPTTISKVLGITPSYLPSPDSKVTVSWVFTVGGVECSIWDYKGYRWSTNGPHTVFAQLFAQYYTATYK